VNNGDVIEMIIDGELVSFKHNDKLLGICFTDK